MTLEKIVMFIIFLAALFTVRFIADKIRNNKNNKNK